MTYEEACQIAAQFGCDAKTEHIEIDVRFAEAFARRLLRVRAEALEEALRSLPAARDVNGEANDFAQGWRAGVLDCATAIRAAKEPS